MTEFCSELAAHEPLAGSAPHKRVWLIIEQPGTWGSDALVESSLPEGLGEELKKLQESLGIGVALARRPDLGGVERRTTKRRRLWLAHTTPGGVRMRAGSLDDISDVLRWDWQAILRGELPPIGRRSLDPVLFVCTNGKKDACCAKFGREIIDELRPDPELTGQIYECTHLGGHRFAPTALLLPYGYIYGRLNVERAREVLAAAWNVEVESQYLRGRSALPQWAQVAEIAVREQAQIRKADVLDVVALRSDRPIGASIAGTLQDGDVIQVRHLDGRAWDVSLVSHEVAARPTSCGDEPKSGTAIAADVVTEVDRWYR
ncbi:MAG: hypothetical protein RIS43_853 [Actinomycetota bacterium]